MGTRGIPAAYGGFETFAEELGARLAARGHDVTVYGRSHMIPDDLKRASGRPAAASARRSATNTSTRSRIRRSRSSTA